MNKKQILHPYLTKPYCVKLPEMGHSKYLKNQQIRKRKCVIGFLGDEKYTRRIFLMS